MGTPSTTRSSLLALVSRRAAGGQLANDNAFMWFLGEIHADLRRYHEGPRWFQNRGRSALVKASPISRPEFGIAEALPQYSGGLGILAGDHLKAASSLGLPLVRRRPPLPAGLLPPALNADGWQEERYPTIDPHAMALTPDRGQPGQRGPRRPAPHRPDLVGAKWDGSSSTCSTPTWTRTPTSCER